MGIALQNPRLSEAEAAWAPFWVRAGRQPAAGSRSLGQVCGVAPCARGAARWCFNMGRGEERWVAVTCVVTWGSATPEEAAVRGRARGALCQDCPPRSEVLRQV